MHAYYRLAKPGIVYGNALPAIAAFLFATYQRPDMFVFLAMLAGLSFSIAGACVFNNVIDRDIDARMERTKNRALPAGQISVQHALIFGFVLFITGSALLYFYVNLLALLATLAGVVAYLAFYTPAKRLTPYSTHIGALAGAMPPVVGYVAVTNTLDTTAVLLFLILAIWQMTHFFAIGIFRLEDYRSAKLPIMPLYANVFRTKVLMLVYAFLFLFATVSLGIVAHLSLWYTLPIALISLGWLVLGIAGFSSTEEGSWARRMFKYSLLTLLAWSALLAFA